MERFTNTSTENVEFIFIVFSFSRENKINSTIVGVDEVGRGPLAGPVFAAAVILSKNICLKGINDSKKLSKKKNV